MARPYSSNKSSFSYPPRYYPDNSTSLFDDLRALVARAFHALVRFWRERGRRIAYGALLSSVYRLRLNLTYRRLVAFPHLLVALWVVVLLWGERWAFHSKVESCHWSNWEQWPAGAEPHRVALVADPQLIDPHSYPGRPWPLNPLTMLITDNYLRRSYNQLQSQLDPDSVFFLGDLFDGGREWKTAHGVFKDPEWGPHPKSEQKYLKKWHKTYGEFYWLQEYARFGDIFFDPWVKSGLAKGAKQKRGKLVASLPGNHDLGFGDQIKLPVRNRFETYFGEGNRIDVIGNHTFVSVDTVSLSAGSSDEAKRHNLKDIYEPVQHFLGSLEKEKKKAVSRELRLLRGEITESQFKHDIEELDKVKSDGKPPADINAPELPTILLTHVPLHRPPGTPCGPLREKSPPSKPPKGQTKPVFPDHRNAISVSAGYQYQNVLNEKDSEDLIRKVGNVVHAFSGDDHDYCAVIHSDAQANVPEITVKSISMAMGVSKPGFLLVSLYNPLDPATGKPLTTGNEQGKTTLQTHLCLLPSQLSTYLRYVTLALVCIAVLAVRAVLVPVLGLAPFALDPAAAAPFSASGRQGRSALLPVFKAKVDDYDEYALPRGFSASHFLNGNGNANAKARDRSGSGSVAGSGLGHGPRKSHGKGSSARKWGWAGAGGGRARAAPRIEIPSEGEEEEEYGGYNGGKWKARAKGGRGGLRQRSVVGVVVREFWTTVWRVAWMVVGFFGWLAWKG
ncbi:Metallo-dependent phosphatase-like protein [Chaetomium sp. MPI-CAGE-AT-0009]|nr:Metallo-dependent phosphatase-like protein [Chaetomium sp. MPI-CAGE-AT-0009]